VIAVLFTLFDYFHINRKSVHSLLTVDSDDWQTAKDMKLKMM